MKNWIIATFAFGFFSVGTPSFGNEQERIGPLSTIEMAIMIGAVAFLTLLVFLKEKKKK